MCHVLAGLIFLLSAAMPPGPNPHLARARQLLELYQEDQALKILEMAIRWSHNTPHDLAEAHLLTGLAWAAKANERNAIESFRQARILDPKLQLEGDHSPRVKLWFEQAISPSTLAQRDSLSSKDVSKNVTSTDRESVDSPLRSDVETPRESPPRLDLMNLPKARAELEDAAVRQRSVALRWGAAASGALGAASVIIGATQGSQAQAHYQQSLGLAEVVQAQGEYRKAVVSAERANILYVVGGGLLVAASAALILSF